MSTSEEQPELEMFGDAVKNHLVDLDGLDTSRGKILKPLAVYLLEMELRGRGKRRGP